MIKLLRSLALVASCLFFSTTAYAGPVTIAFAENTSAFSLTLTGSAITQNLTYEVMLGTSWQISFKVTESINPRDAVTVEASARHIQAPHGEPASSFTFMFRAGIMVSQIGPFQMAMTRDADNQPHVIHFNDFLGRLELFGLNGQSTKYTFHMEGTHCTTVSQCPSLPEEQEIPEPATLLLLGTGVSALTIKLRRRMGSKNNRDALTP